MKIRRLLVEGGKVSMKPPFGQIFISYEINPKKLIDLINEKTKNFFEKKIFIKIWIYSKNDFKVEIESIPTTQYIKDILQIKKITQNLKGKLNIKKKDLEEIILQKKKIRGKNFSQKISQLKGTCRSMGIRVDE